MKIIALLLLLTGCATAPAIVHPQIVDVPIATPCKISIPEHPAWPTEILPKEVTDSVWLRAALEELQLRVAYELKLEASAIACSK